MKLNAFGMVGPEGVIEHYDDWSEDADEIIEEAVTCQVHGEGPVEKLVAPLGSPPQYRARSPWADHMDLLTGKDPGQ